MDSFGRCLMPTDIVGDSGDSPGLENAVKRLGQFFFLFTSMEAKCKPVKNVRVRP